MIKEFTPLKSRNHGIKISFPKRFKLFIEKKFPFYYTIKEYYLKFMYLFKKIWFIFVTVGVNLCFGLFIVISDTKPKTSSQSEAIYSEFIIMTAMLLFVFFWKAVLKSRRYPQPRGKFGC